MGKIVKSARFTGDRYVVEVPRTEMDHEAVSDPTDRDDRFAVSFPEPSTNGHTERIALPQPELRVDWETLRADAEAIVDRAAGDAESLIRIAETKAVALIDEAKVRAAQIESDARAAGRDEGFSAGKAQAEGELEPVITTMRELIESVRTQRVSAIMAAEPELARLAMAVAERVVQSEVLTNPQIVVENVRQALTRLVSREVVTLRVNPIDLDMIRQHRDQIVAASDVEHLRIVEDQRVDRGGVMLETDAGTIDSKIATQLREARRAILSDDDEIALGDGEILHAPAQAS